jgi:glycosyltransferase involved in cell wall biosynthesis
VNVQWINAGERLDVARGEVVVCIPVYGGHDHFTECLRSVLAHTPSEVPILICDDASPDPRSRQWVDELSRGTTDPDAARHGQTLFYLRRAHNVGFPANVNGAFACASPADVVVLNSDCVVAAGWLEGLRAAACSDSQIATASALADNGSHLSVPDARMRLAPAGTDWDFDAAAAAVRAGALRLRPRLMTAAGHCMYVRRSALDLVGDFDLAFTPGYGEEVDFSQRCLHMALAHVAADDVLVRHHGGASLSANGVPHPAKRAHEAIIDERYPYYRGSVTATRLDAPGPLVRSLGVARRAVNGLSVHIDARSLRGPMTGTQLHVLELIAALAATGRVRLGAIVPSDLSDYAQAALTRVPGIQLVPAGSAAAVAAATRADIVHRPSQISTPADLSLPAQLSDRLMITHQDMISYRNPSYFDSFAAWEGYRQLTRRALAVADRVMFFSAHARDEALAEELLEPERASVVHIGVDHILSTSSSPPVAPAGVERIPAGAEVMLCLGTDFRHKNRVFALRVLDELQQRHHWSGRLVLAGPRVERGSSMDDERRLLERRPELASALVNLGAVNESEKAWLLARSRLVLYPTVYEGFGLVPFEAADHGVPCLWAAGTALSEVLPAAAAGIVAWDAEGAAARALALMRDESARRSQLEAVRVAAAGLRWATTAERLIEIYGATCDGPPAPAALSERDHGLMQRGFSDDALRLVGPDGVLPADVERPLLALATHPQLGAPVFRALKAGYRASARLRRLGPGATRA